MYKMHEVEPHWLRTTHSLNEIRVYSNYCEMDLYDRYGNVRDVTTFDNADLAMLSSLKWGLRNDGYVWNASSRVALHRRLVSPPVSMQVDHINGNKLDNRRENLRLATQSEQRHNTTCTRSNTGIKGVSYIKNSDSYLAHIDYNCVAYTKHFYSLNEAEHWVRNKREELHGEFANHGD